MKTLAQVQADRDAAGAAYASAAQAYVDAFVELHAHDMALAARTGDNAGFAALNEPNGHPKYLRQPLHDAWGDRVRSRGAEISASMEA